MDKYIRGIEELNLGRRIGGGSCSNIYEFEKDTYFKEFDEEYRDLSDPINVEFYETISGLSSIKGMPFIIRAIDIYRSLDEIFGYDMPSVAAIELQSISDGVFVNDLFNSFLMLRKDLWVLAENFVKTEDVGGGNILYNGNMYLIDLDLSLIDPRYIPEELYCRSVNSVLGGIRECVLGDKKFGDVVKPENCEGYLYHLKDICAYGLGRKVSTIGDMRQGYQKIKNMNIK